MTDLLILTCIFNYYTFQINSYPILSKYTNLAPLRMHSAFLYVIIILYSKALDSLNVLFYLVTWVQFRELIHFPWLFLLSVYVRSFMKPGSRKSINPASSGAARSFIQAHCLQPLGMYGNFLPIWSFYRRTAALALHGCFGVSSLHHDRIITVTYVYPLK